MRKLLFVFISAFTLLISCGKPQGGGSGGELVGVRGNSWAESSPYGMVLVSRGSYEMGPSDSDSLWGIEANPKGVSIDAFWMDDTEITNSEYRQFVYWVRDSIIRERLADPTYGGDETFKITEDRYGDPIKPYLNWKKPIPWKRADEDQERAINSVMYTHPVTGQKGLNVALMNYKYDWFNLAEAAKRKYRLDPNERILDTDITVNPEEIIMISKDTAYINEEGLVINQTITRPLNSLFDFYNTRIVAIYPDTTCWVNDFNNAYNEPYMRMYFSHSGYNDYPVVGVTWEQATAFCNWRTAYYEMGMGVRARNIEPYRLPTEGEWEFAARDGKTANRYPWDGDATMTDRGCFMANFKPGEGDYTQDGNLITSRVGSYRPNRFGLYDMAGNVSEWTSTTYTEAGSLNMNDMNPQYQYDAAKEDPYASKKKVIKGGSWKDIGMFIRGDMRDYEYQNQPRSYVGFRCVRTQIGFAKSRK